MSLEIRELESEPELRTCFSLQKDVWGLDDELADPAELKRAQQDGAILLGAFDEGNGLAGFVFSYRIKGLEAEAHHSHMLAVRPGLRDQGIGVRLKEAQFQVARKRGARWVVWTFDPLESRNSHLNLNKLGARAQSYFVDFYPGSRSLLHVGLETDRLLAERDLQAGVNRSLPPPSSDAVQHKAVEAVRSFRGLPVPGLPRLDRTSELVLIEIPWDIQALKRTDPVLAAQWREATRQAFRHYFDNGFVAEGFLRQANTEPRRAFHLLRHDPLRDSLHTRLDFSTRPFKGR